METITRDQAQAYGLKRFYTGEPCFNNHDAERYVTSNSCVVCVADNQAKWLAQSDNRVKVNHRCKQRYKSKAAAERFTRIASPHMTKDELFIQNLRQYRLNWCKPIPEIEQDYKPTLRKVQSEIARQIAGAKGEKYYMTGHPCINGHDSPRRIEDTRCVECCKTQRIKKLKKAKQNA